MTDDMCRMSCRHDVTDIHMFCSVNQRTYTNKTYIYMAMRTGCMYI